MSNYNKATNFATKDTLPSGDPNKIVKGTEINNELNAISNAIASKADLASPTFTGVPAAPTATAGSNTTQIANTAYVKNALDSLGTMSTQNANAVAITGGTITGLSSPLPVPSGGTGAASFTANNLLVGNGTSAIQTLAPSTSGNVLTSNGTSWQSASLPGMRGQIFTSSGTFTIPSGATSLKVTVLGAGGNGTNGGAGDGSWTPGTAGAGGNGGAGGGLAWSFLTGLTVGNTIVVTVGSSGGNSSVSSGTQTITTITAGGNGGSVTGGQLNMPGAAGYGRGSSTDTSGWPGGGGGGNGGEPVAYGKRGLGADGIFTNGQAGGAATGYGAGGGGGSGGGSYSGGYPGGAGGAGSPGFVMFEY
jgi:hypothetical protein